MDRFPFRSWKDGLVVELVEVELSPDAAEVDLHEQVEGNRSVTV